MESNLDYSSNSMVTLRASTTSVLVYSSNFVDQNLTIDLTDKMLMHVTKNYIVGFVFEHNFKWCNFL